jgi:polyisoprenoid-binding protein YceI
MKLKQVIASSAIIAGLTFAGNWNIDLANAKISFTVKGPFGTVHGNFTGLKATIKFDEKDLSGSSISANVDAKTVSTGIGLRNHDLRTEEEWLNTDKYPQITFISKKIEKTTTGYNATGELTLKGVTKALEIPFTFTNKADDGLFKGQFSIKREDYGVGKEGGSVGSIITIVLEVPVKK